MTATLRAVPRAAIGLALAGSLHATAARASLEQAELALREGRYEAAIESFREESVRTPTPRLYRGLVEALRLTGRSDEAIEAIEAFLAREPASVQLENARGRILNEAGRTDEAREAFERAIAGGASDRLVAELRLAVLEFETGSVDDAMQRFDAFIDVYNRSSALGVDELVAVGVACQYLGATNPDLFRDALKAFDEARAKDPSRIEPLIHAGSLFLEKYNSPDASSSFGDALKLNEAHPEALLGLAKVQSFDGSPEALSLAEKAPRDLAGLRAGDRLCRGAPPRPRGVRRGHAARGRRARAQSGVDARPSHRSRGEAPAG